MLQRKAFVQSIVPILRTTWEFYSVTFEDSAAQLSQWGGTSRCPRGRSVLSDWSVTSKDVLRSLARHSGSSESSPPTPRHATDGERDGGEGDGDGGEKGERGRELVVSDSPSSLFLCVRRGLGRASDPGGLQLRLATTLLTPATPSPCHDL